MPRWIASLRGTARDESSISQGVRQTADGTEIGGTAGGGVFFVTAATEAEAKTEAASLLGVSPARIKVDRY